MLSLFGLCLLLRLSFLFPFFSLSETGRGGSHMYSRGLRLRMTSPHTYDEVFFYFIIIPKPFFYSDDFLLTTPHHTSLREIACLLALVPSPAVA